MTRDMDLIREILLKLEAWPLEAGQVFIIEPTDLVTVIPDYDVAQISYHMNLISAAGFINDGDGTSGPMLGFLFCGLTWRGHDFLDSVRDPAIWKATKEGASKAGGFSLDLLGALAKGLLKKKIEEHTGVKLDL